MSQVTVVVAVKPWLLTAVMMRMDKTACLLKYFGFWRNEKD